MAHPTSEATGLLSASRPGRAMVRVARLCCGAAAVLACVYVAKGFRGQPSLLLRENSPEYWTQYYAESGGFPIDSLRTGFPTYAAWAADRLPTDYITPEDGTANMVPIYDDNRTLGQMNATQNDAYAAYLSDWHSKWDAWPWQDTDLVAPGEDERSEGDGDLAVLDVGPTRYEFSAADAALDAGPEAAEDFGRGREMSFEDLARDLQDEDFYGPAAVQVEAPEATRRGRGARGAQVRLFPRSFGAVSDDALLNLRRDVDGSDPLASGESSANSGRFGVFPDYGGVAAE